jgi:hypothetical protein
MWSCGTPVCAWLIWARRKRARAAKSGEVPAFASSAFAVSKSFLDMAMAATLK